MLLRRGRASARAARAGRCALCEDDHTVSRSPSGAASAPRGSIGDRGQARDHVLGPHDVRGGRERRRDVAGALLPARELGSPARGSTTAVQRLVVDLDALGGILGLRARLRDDRRDGLARRSAPRRRRAADAGAARPSARAAARPARGTDAAARCPAARPAARRARRSTRAWACGRAHERHVQPCRRARMSSRNSRAAGQHPRVLPAADRLAERADDAHGGRGYLGSCRAR